MSVPAKGKTLPKLGKKLPTHGRDHLAINYSAAIALALSAELRNSSRSIKTVMKWSGASERTVKGWLSGANGPRGEHLIALLRRSDRVFTCVLELAGRRPILEEQQLLALKQAFTAAVSTIDAGLDADAC